MKEIIFTLIATHITIVCVTVFLHRGQAHRGLIFHPILSHFMRFWLWLTTGMVTKQWVAIHRKHHRFSDQEGDPHTPHVYGIWTVLFKGAALYHQASKDPQMVATYGQGTPDDWIERKLYSAHSRLGIALMLVIDLVLFGPIGFIVWGIQMIWIPFWAAGVINGVGHWFGYRNGSTKDQSRNISPWGIIIGGEELHNNHHLDPASPKLSRRWFEFDIGWFWIQVFKSLGLVKLKVDN
jgi:stearoyl-CoA desaturase (Delta-9 desaturase)